MDRLLLQEANDLVCELLRRSQLDAIFLSVQFLLRFFFLHEISAK